MKSDAAIRDPRVSRRTGVSWSVAVALVVSACGLLLVGWGLGALARSFTQPVDLDAVQTVATHRTGSLTAAARALSLVGSGYIVFPLAAILGVGLYCVGRVRASLALAVSVGGAVAISTGAKLLVGRPRPPVHHLEHVASASFPSGHTTQASAFCGTLLIIFFCHRPGRIGVALATVATAGLVLGIALSRVYLGVHYPSDIAGGLLLGASWSAITTASLLPRHQTKKPS